MTFFMNGEGDGLETRGGTATEEKQRLAGDSLVDRDTSLPPTPRDRQGTAGPGRPLSSGLETVSRFFQPSDDYGGITQPLDQPSGKEVLIRSSKGHSLISLPPPPPAFCSRPATWPPQPRRYNTRLAHRGPQAAGRSAEGIGHQVTGVRRCSCHWLCDVRRVFPKLSGPSFTHA